MARLKFEVVDHGPINLAHWQQFPKGEYAHVMSGAGLSPRAAGWSVLSSMRAEVASKAWPDGMNELIGTISYLASKPHIDARSICIVSIRWTLED